MPSYSPPIKWLDLLTKAASLAGIIQDTDTLQPTDANVIAQTLMFFLAELSAKGVNLRNFTTEQFVLTGNKRQYNFGIGGDFNSARPTEITNCQLLLAVGPQPFNTSNDMKIWTKDQYYGELQDYLGVTGPSDTLFPEYAMPFVICSFYPIPDQSYTIVMTSQKELAFMGQFTDLISLENIYLPVLLYGLVCKICPEFGKTLDVKIENAYKSSLGDVMDLGFQPAIMESQFPSSSIKSSGSIINPFSR